MSLQYLLQKCLLITKNVFYQHGLNTKDFQKTHQMSFTSLLWVRIQHKRHLKDTQTMSLSITKDI
jgi:hypothetical protein